MRPYLLKMLLGSSSLILLAGSLAMADGPVGVQASHGAVAQVAKLGSTDDADASILAFLDIANRTDIEGGKLARKKASDQKVKDYAGRMVSDHQAMLKKGSRTAKHLQLAPAPDSDSNMLYMEHKKHMDELRDADGRSFDRAYIEHEITAHKDVLDKIDKAKAEATHPAVKDLLEQARPVIELHLDQATAIMKSMSG